MNNFNFGEVLTRAWQIVWKHKVLWVFGILAGCGRSGGNFNSNNRWSSNNGPTPNLPPQVMQWARWIENNVTTFIAIMVAVICIIWIVTTFLGVIGKIGLIRGTAQAERGAERLIFGQLFSESIPYFWRMLGLSLILAVPILILVISIAAFAAFGLVAASAGDNTRLASLGIIPLVLGCCCLFVPAMFVAGMIFRQAENAIMLEEMSVLPSISRGWEVFRNNLGPIILMAIILAVIGVVVGLVIAIPVFIIVFPAIIAYAAGNGQNTTPLILAGVGFCLYLPVMWLLSGMMTAYVESAWTLTYMRLTGTSAGGDHNTTPAHEDPVLPEDGDKTSIATSNA